MPGGGSKPLPILPGEIIRPATPDLYRVTVVRKPDPKQQQVLADALKKKQK